MLEECFTGIEERDGPVAEEIRRFYGALVDLGLCIDTSRHTGVCLEPDWGFVLFPTKMPDLLISIGIDELAADTEWRLSLRSASAESCMDLVWDSVTWTIVIVTHMGAPHKTLHEISASHFQLWNPFQSSKSLEEADVRRFLAIVSTL